MTLTEQLKHIYATGDNMTVLKMLKGLIDAVENYEGRTATSDQVEHLTEKVGEMDVLLDQVADDVEFLGSAVTNLEKPVYANYITLYVSNVDYDMYFYFTIMGKKIVTVDDLAIAMPWGERFSASGVYLTDDANGVVLSLAKTRVESDFRHVFLEIRYADPNDMNEYKTASVIMQTDISGEEADVAIASVYSKLLLGVER